MMKYLNLDPNFSPFEGNINFKSFLFSGGEPHIKIEEEIGEEEEVTVTTRINSFNDMGLFLVAIDALKRMRVHKINAFIPYFPGARQDRLMVSGEPLTVKVYADIINGLDLHKVFLFDPHSEVTPAVVNHAEVISNNPFVKEVVTNMKDYYLVAPDGGALKKIYKTAQYLNGVPVIECGKTRDVATGKLSGFKVYAEDLEGKTCVVVDDICDGGGTFLGLADELKKKNAGELILVVSHGIFNKGFSELLEKYSKIYTTNSVKEITHENVYQVKLDHNWL